MFSKVILVAVLAVLGEARFQQEQIPIPAIAAVKGGDAGEAQTIAGQAVSDLLGAANACAKLQRGDEIIAKLGTGADALAAAIGIVAAEKNFNNFAAATPAICSDPTLPATPELRGITPLIDPGVVGSDIANALSAQTVKTPLAADGKSVADLLAENGFTNFTTQDAAGKAGAAPAAAAGAAAAAPAAAAAAAPAAADAAAAACAAPAADAAAADAKAAAAPAAAAAAAAAPAAAAAGSGDLSQKTTLAGADFGKCTPTMIFEAGQPGRKPDEFTFQVADPLARGGQEDALNPNIIANKICDQLTNVCDANQVAKDACDAAQAKVESLGTRDKSTADAFNEALGFAGFVTNPDGGPADKPAAAAAAARSRKIRRSAKFFS